ncbi:MAG: V-type ATPase subunit [Spirochaetia bacterium]
MSSPVKKYAFIHAKLRARLGKMLDREFFFRLSIASGLTEALHMLKGTEYEKVSDTYDETGDLKLGELELFRREIETVRNIVKYVEDEISGFVEGLLMYHEIEVLKHALRLWFDRTVRNRDIRRAVGYIIRERIVHDFRVDDIINAENPEGIEAALEGTPYRDIAVRHIPEVIQRGSLFSLETELDKFYYRTVFERLELLQGRDRNTAERFLSAEVDLENLNRIVRFNSFYDYSYKESLPFLLPYGRAVESGIFEGIESADKDERGRRRLYSVLLESYGLTDFPMSETSGEGNSLVLLNSLMEEIIDREIKKILYGYPFTIGIILAFIVLKQKEIRKLMSLLNAQYYELPEEKMRRIV